MALEIEEAIFSRLSAARLHSYMSATGGDLSNAIRLYHWNIQISAALFEVLAVVEIVVRNSWHQQLQVASQKRTGSAAWTSESHGLLNEYSLEDIQRARQRLKSRGKLGNSDQVVAELNFGFWRFLFAKQYRTTLWPLVGKHAFPNLEPSKINELSRVMGQLHDLRNRIAHHEPIHGRDLGNDLANSLWVIGGVCMTTRDWTSQHSRVSEVLRSRRIT